MRNEATEAGKAVEFVLVEGDLKLEDSRVAGATSVSPSFFSPS